MLWSFARDGGVPMYRVWAAVSPITQTPVNAVWAMTALAFLLGIPMLWSPTAFNAIGSITSLGLYLSCEPSSHSSAPIIVAIWQAGLERNGCTHMRHTSSTHAAMQYHMC